MRFEPFDAMDDAHIRRVTALWNAACGPDLAITEQAVRFNSRPATGVTQAGMLVQVAGRWVGFVLAKARPADPATPAPGTGWVDAITVDPDHQRQGTGAALLAWAEDWLALQGYQWYSIGGGPRPYAPGVPVELESVPFFEHRGYQLRPDGEHVWDVARDLRDYASPAAVQACDAVISPAQPGEEEALLAFLWREFPAGWHWEFQEFLREHGRLSDYVLLRTGRGVEGFCQTTFEDSLRPLDRFFPHRLPRPWGQLGPIGVSRDARGLGYGAALLDAGLCLLRERGVAGCVIDWTGLLAFYGKFGFEPYRRYAMLVKTQP